MPSNCSRTSGRQVSRSVTLANKRSTCVSCPKIRTGSKPVLFKYATSRVNKEKTHLVHAFRGVKFLGVEIGLQWTRIQDKKIAAFKTKVKALTRRNSPVNLEQVIQDLTPVLRGFANYFRMANCKGLFAELMMWIRRRLRAKQLALWKRPGRLHRRLRQLGYQGGFPKIRMTRWRNSNCPQATWAMPNVWFRASGLFDLTSVETGVLPQIT